MSLVSGSSIIGGLKEYVYRGVQQLPIVLAATSLVFTITTGSVAHANLALGLSILVPLYTMIIHKILSWLLPTDITLSRATGDTCNILQSIDSKKLKFSLDSTTTLEMVPSYWLMSLSFFFGYVLTNALDSLLIPSQPNANPDNVEKRSSQAIYCIVAVSVFTFIVGGIRLGLMRDCEGRHWHGILLSIVAAAVSALLGRAMYNLARTCGGRASDLLGIISQILPASSMTPHPIVCAAE